MKSNLNYLTYILTFLILMACSKMDHTYSEFLQGGEKVYSVKPKSIQFYPGNNRMKLKIALVSAPNIKKVQIYWNGKNDFIEWEIEPDLTNDTTYVEGIIDPINEGRHTFEFVTYDKAGNHSIEMDTVGVVYGDDYETTLQNRGLHSAVLKENQVQIKWLDTPYERATGVEVFYKNMEGETIQVKVPLDEFETQITARPLDDSIHYRTVYTPDDNAIDTFYAKVQSVMITPPMPEQLDKSRFVALVLPGDATSYSSSVLMDHIWDDDLTGNSWYGTSDPAGNPHWYTFDLGVKAKLTEYTIWQRGVVSTPELVYAHANMKKWELWGSNEPDEDGGWGNWTRLVESESFKPSGLPFGEVTEADYEYAANGDTFTFSSDVPSVRYIRVKVFETWDPAKSHRSFLQEMSFEGIVD